MTGQFSKISDTDNPAGYESGILRHELVNVLNGLIGMTELLGASSLSRQQRLWLRAIRGSGKQLDALVSRLDTVHESGMPGQRRKRIDGIDLLEQAIISQVPAARSKANHLLLHIDPHLPRFWLCDPCRLRQVLDNLLGNANKFTNDGIVAIEASRDNSAGSQRDLKLLVTDTGHSIGIREADRIFRARYRAAASQGIVGTGLGLYVCRQNLQAMGGQIQWLPGAESGNCFKVSLPHVFPEHTSSVETPMAPLLDMQCHLSVSTVYRSSIEGLLKRLGVGFRQGHNAGTGSAGGGPLVELFNTEQASPGAGMAEFQLRLQNQPALARILHAPVLESTLALSLLELAFEWLSPGDMRG